MRVHSARLGPGAGARLVRMGSCAAAATAAAAAAGVAAAGGNDTVSKKGTQDWQGPPA